VCCQAAVSAAMDASSLNQGSKCTSPTCVAQHSCCMVPTCWAATATAASASACRPTSEPATGPAPERPHLTFAHCPSPRVIPWHGMPCHAQHALTRLHTSLRPTPPCPTPPCPSHRAHLAPRPTRSTSRLTLLVSSWQGSGHRLGCESDQASTQTSTGPVRVRLVSEALKTSAFCACDSQAGRGATA